MNWQINQTVDLTKGQPSVQVWPTALMVVGDNLAHVWNISVVEKYAPVNLDGYTAYVYFVREDGKSVYLDGSISGNTISIKFDEKCYAIQGSIRGVVKAKKGDQVLTMSDMVFVVRHGTGTEVIDPGEVIPNLETLLAKLPEVDAIITEAEKSIEIANAAADRANEAADRLNWNFLASDDGNGNVTLSGLVDVFDDNAGNVTIGPFSATV